MNVDPWIVIAQIVNFLLLVWLLRRFLYEPVVKVIAERDARLQASRRRAEEREDAARAEEDKYKEMAARLEAERRQILQEAAAHADRERERLLAEARSVAAKAREEMYDRLRAERSEVEAQIREGIVREACASAGKIVTELTGTSVSDALIDTMERRLAGVHPPTSSDKALDIPIEIRTSFEPQPAQRERLRSMVESWIGSGATPELSFVQDPTLVLGIEISLVGERVSWSARDVLESVVEGALTRMRPGDGSEAIRHA